MSFVHLHVHTQYSILDGLSAIPKLFDRAEELGMPALAITDHGNMYGVKEFFKYAKKHPKVKPIIGCEVYVTRHYDPKLKDAEHRKYYHLILLAKNYNGYKHLMKICSLGHIEGSYYGKPRVSHEIIEKYHEDLICCSACVAGEIPSNIIAGNYEAAREAVQWHKKVFGDDYYLEVQLHKTEVPGLSLETFECQNIANSGIFELAETCGVKVIATNDVHFVNKEDGPAHDRLICLTTNAFIDDPSRMRYTQQEYLKSEEEMRLLFPGHPEVIDNTMEIYGKIGSYKIDRGHVLPKFDLDPDFLADIDTYLGKYKDIIDAGSHEDVKDGDGKVIDRKYRGDDFCKSVAFLCHLTYEGARKRYGETLNEEQSERIDFELKTISRMGFPDYFLIVQDYIQASRKMGSMVGPGRGSAAGSVVAYCLGITNLDPIKYQLLFERFLNPDRISMPDIDVDFQDLLKAHQYVEKKYTPEHVSRVITFGTMAAKSAIKDVARISHVTIEESNRLAKLVPDRLSEMVEKEYPYNPKFDEVKSGFKVIEKEVEEDDPDKPGEKIKVMKTFQKGKEEVAVKNITLKDCFRLVPEFKNELENGTDLNKEVLKYALQLEGSIRQVGMHACATIIGPGDLTDYIPICLSKDKETGDEVWTSQYDGHYIEDVGMLKMDFLGLNTLSIISECLSLIKSRFGTDIDIEAIPIDDPEVYALYGRGDTTSVFQFESPGMKEHLQNLHPERFEDLIAMNALYRPGPMDYIPDFIARKLGQQEITYDLPEMKEFLEETYGITVYQEQVMLLSRKLANFTKGEADKLRKAMGKKQIDILNSLKDKFMKGGQENGHPDKILDKIWKDWEKFAQYAFNKSHATCYAWVSYQTAWLKAHYPAEFQAANLTCNLGKMDEIKKIMKDCKKSKVKVKNPDINDSMKQFAVNKEGDIHFGLGGIKGFGDNMVKAILSERESGGRFSDIFDFVERMSKTEVGISKRSLESLVFAGAFDSFGLKRAQFLTPCKNGDLFIDELARYADNLKRDNFDSGMSLFGEVAEMKPSKPEIPEYEGTEDYISILHKEKELVGMYLSAHPLDKYRFEINNFTNCTLSELAEKEVSCTEKQQVETVSLACFVSEHNIKTSKSGKPYTDSLIEDFSGNYRISLFGKDAENFMGLFTVGGFLYLSGRIEPKYFIKPEERGSKPVEHVFRLKSAMLLGNLAESKIKEFQLRLDMDKIDSGLKTAMVDVIKRHKGPTPLTILVSDKKNGYNVEFMSRKYKVSISTELIDDLNDIGIEAGFITK